MPVSKLISSFNAGELSPFMDARADVEKYESGCRLLENFITLPYGGVYRRPGTEYLGQAKHNDKRCRLIGFNFSTSTRFVLEFGEQYIRFWSNGVQVEDPNNPGNPLEVATPYQESEIRDVQYVQINDVMYFCHPVHHPQKLIRKADDDWEFAEVEWDWPALLDENVGDITIAPSATTGTGITLTASDDLFQPGHVGSLWQIAHRRDNAYVEKKINATGASSSIKVLGKWEFTTYGTWKATIVIERSDNGGSTWEQIRSYNSDGDRNVSSSGDEEREVLLRINVTAYTSNTGGRSLLEVQDARQYGIVKITGYTSETSVDADVVVDLQSTNATKLWAEGAWSTLRGFPRSVTLHDGRLFYAGTAYRPLSIWGSSVDDFQNFRISAKDDSGLFYSLSAKEANAVQWMESQGDLLIGTSGDEWTLGSSDSDSALTPTNVRATRQSSYGSKHLSAAIVNDVILFVQRSGRKLRELVYQFEKDGWVAPDLTVLAEHVTKGEILEAAYQQQPDAIFWAIRGDGQLIGMTYERDQNIVGWHRHTTQGEFESVATIYGSAGGPDEVWLSVRRVIDGQEVRYIERFHPDWRTAFDAEDKPEWWYLDCAKRIDNSPKATTVSGLEHLEGKEVQILADGAATPNRTVEGGEIELQYKAGRVLVGLSFVSALKPMRLEMMLQDGASRGRTKRVHRVVASFFKSLAGQYSTDGKDWNWFYPREISDNMDDSPPVFTGDMEVVSAGDFDNSADITIRQAQPFPLTLLALVAKYDIYGD